MKRKIAFIASFLAFGLITSAVSSSLQLYAAIPPVATTISMVGLAFLIALFNKRPTMPGVHTAGIQKEIWTAYIMGAIFKYNAFLGFAYNADEHVLAGKVVHIPQAGGTATVVKNRSSLPATVTKRTDTDRTYALDEFTTDPRCIPNADTIELAYDKMDSVMTDDMNALRQTVAENMLIAWAPATRIIRTTGADVVAHTTAATGNRKKFICADLKRAQKEMNKAGVAPEERYALMDADMYDQITDELTESQYRDFSRAFDEKTGVMGMLYGFKILTRQTVLVYNNAGTPVVKAYGAAGATTDNAAVLCWQKNAVERAIGEIKVFNEDDSPIYYGDLFSFLMRAGGAIRRDDEVGVLAIVQAAGS
jgi:hypothetical protein